MGDRDVKAKEYLSDNKRFADLCNYVLFDGEQVITAESLLEKDTAEVLSVLGTDGKEQQNQKLRDLLKSAIIKTNEDIILVLVGVENQSDIHYAMPVRNMIYDALDYGAQVKNAAKSIRKNRVKGYQQSFCQVFIERISLFQ